MNANGDVKEMESSHDNVRKRARRREKREERREKRPEGRLSQCINLTLI